MLFEMVMMCLEIVVCDEVLMESIVMIIVMIVVVLSRIGSVGMVWCVVDVGWWC